MLHVQLEFESYPEGVSFTVARQWGDIRFVSSQSICSAVKAPFLCLRPRQRSARLSEKNVGDSWPPSFHFWSPEQVF